MSAYPQRTHPQRSRILAIVVALVLLGLLVWGFVVGRREIAIERAREQPVRAVSRVSEDRGEVVITLDAATQARSAIRTAALVATRQQAQVRGFATVMDLQPLAADRVAYAQAGSDLAQTQAAAAASGSELQRTRLLNRDDKNLSDKALEAAQASQRADRARVQAAGTAARLRADAVRQQWGPVIARWLVDDAAALQRLLSSRDVLLRVALPDSASAAEFPPTLRIAIGRNAFTSAQLVSTAPQVDPQLQGATAFYRADAAGGLQPGRNLDIWLPQGGGDRAGAVVPLAAVVWWQGRAWAYLQQDTARPPAAARFVRHEVDTGAPVTEGYFIADAGLVGRRVVVQGAQLLLSEEFRAQIQVGEEGRK